jgi:hypothetical protein
VPPTYIHLVGTERESSIGGTAFVTARCVAIRPGHLRGCVVQDNVETTADILVKVQRLIECPLMRLVTLNSVAVPLVEINFKEVRTRIIRCPKVTKKLT